VRVALNPSTGALELRDEDVAGAAGKAAVWPLEFDAGSGALRVSLDGLTISARPLNWREKRVLARYADLGEAFLQRQLIDACCGTRAVAAAPAVCRALAAWVNFPAAPESVAVPFASEALARVTAGLCRTIGLRPAEIDALDALEVEALWQSQAQGRQAVPAANVADEPADGPTGGVPASAIDSATTLTTPAMFPGIGEMQTIRIVADPPTTDDAPAAPLPSPEAAQTTSSFSKPATPANRDQPPGTPLPRRAARRELAARLRAVALDEASVAGPTAAQHMAPFSEALAEPPSGLLPSALSGSFHSRFPEPLFNPLLPDRSSASSAPAMTPSLRLVGSAPTSAAQTNTVPIHPAPSSVPADWLPVAGGDRSRPAIDPSRARSPAGEGGGAIFTPVPSASAAVQADDRAFDFEILLDTFSERLEQAAVDAGVDLEAY